MENFSDNINIAENQRNSQRLTMTQKYKRMAKNVEELTNEMEKVQKIWKNYQNAYNFIKH